MLIWNNRKPKQRALLKKKKSWKVIGGGWNARTLYLQNAVTSSSNDYGEGE